MKAYDTAIAGQRNGCPECCCVMGSCCDAAKARAAFAKKLMTDLDCTPEEAKYFVDWTLQHFTLAPPSFRQVIADMVRMFRQHHQAGAAKDEG